MLLPPGVLWSHLDLNGGSEIGLILIASIHRHGVEKLAFMSTTPSCAARQEEEDVIV